MKFRISNNLLFILLSFLMVIPHLSYAKIKIKMGSLGQRGTAYAVTSIGFKKIVENVAKNAEEDVNVTIYWSGVMGGEAAMVQKSNLGQLDGGFYWTLAGARHVSPLYELLNFPFLIGREGGEGHYVRHKLRNDITNNAYKRKWVVMHFQNEGFGTLFCLGKPIIRTPNDLKKHKCATNMGITDNAFYEAHGIKPILLTDEMAALQSARTGALSCGIGPIIFIVGAQMYTIFEEKGGGFVRPDLRFAICGVQITKRSFDRLSWRVKARLFYFPMPVLEYATYFITYDAEASTEISLLDKYNCEVSVLRGETLKTFTEPVKKLYPKYVGNKPERVEFYNKILKHKNYFANNKNNIDTHLVHKYNQDYKLSNKNLREIRAALDSYVKTGSLVWIKRITDKHIIEKWRLYERIKAAEQYAASGNSKSLKEHFSVMMPDPFIEELFNEHMEDVKDAYGTKQAIKDRVSEVIYMIDEIFKIYPKSYQERDSKSKRTWL